MNTISINYDLKWQYAKLPHYKWTTCGKLINVQTGRRLKKTMNGRSIGYWVPGNFVTLNNQRADLERIPQKTCPF